MCGIAGIFNYRNGNPVDETVLRDMASALAHRGPDDEGFHVDPDRRLGFAFRRLSIVDLSTGHQPMPGGDGRYRIIFNGEIYNHRDIRKGLESRGHRFRTQSDTEVVVEAYAAYGPRCVEHLQGMFAFVVWDSRDRRLFLARDRIGIKPLYYADAGGTVVFASEIKALARHPALSLSLDPDQLGRYLTFLCIPPPATLFRGVRKLRAGHTLTLECDAAPGSQERYWMPVAPRDRPASEASLVEELRSLLTDSVRGRLMSDVPFGAFLSGGVDSSGIVGLMSGMLGEPVETFTVGYKDDPDMSEFEHARFAARTFGTNHHEILIDHRDFKEFLPRLVRYQDEPIADPVCVPLYFVAELARRHGVIVTLVGEGSDELFFGYDIYNRLRDFHRRIWRPLAAAPGFVRSAATWGAGLFVDDQRRDYLRRLREGGEPFLGGAVTFYPEERRRLAPGLPEAHDPMEVIGDLYAEFDAVRPDGDFIERSTYLELMLRLPELLLMRVDKMTMATSVEGRVPFLDHRLVEFSFRVPGSLKVKNGVRKYILKRALEGIVPPEILHRPKVGFHVPVTRWFQEVLSPLAVDVLHDRSFLDLGIWSEREIDRLLERQRQGRGNYGMRIWALMNLALWHRHWFAGGGE